MPKPQTQSQAASPQYNTATFDSFGVARVDKKNATLIDDYYIIGDNKDKNKKQLYHVLKLRDDDSGEEYEVRNWAAYLCDKDGTRLSWAPSPDGMTLAGPEGVGEEDYIALGSGQSTLADLDESYTDEDFSGPHAVGRDSTMPGPALRMLREYLKKCLESEDQPIPGSTFKDFHGYSFFWSQEAQEQRGNRKKSTDGQSQDQQEFTVLVPVTFLSAPKNAGAGSVKKDASKSASKGGAASKANGKDADDTAALDAEIEEEVTNLLSEADGPLDKKGWQAPLVSRFQTKYKDDAKKKQALVQRVLKAGNTGWFLDDSRPWTVDGDAGTISL